MMLILGNDGEGDPPLLPCLFYLSEESYPANSLLLAARASHIRPYIEENWSKADQTARPIPLR